VQDTKGSRRAGWHECDLSVGGFEELLDAESEHVSLDATKHMLAIEGIKPAAEPTTNVNLNVRAGYVIMLDDDPPKKAIDVTLPRRYP
jgi:hypothetical protein